MLVWEVIANASMPRAKRKPNDFNDFWIHAGEFPFPGSDGLNRFMKLPTDTREHWEIVIANKDTMQYIDK